MFSLIFALNKRLSISNREAGDLRHHGTRYDSIARREGKMWVTFVGFKSGRFPTPVSVTLYMIFDITNHVIKIFACICDSKSKHY